MKVIAALVLAIAPTQQAPAPAPGGDVAELSRLESAWNDAHLRCDAAVLDRLWADDLVVVVPKMTPVSKPEALAFFRGGRMKFSCYESSELAVRVYADTAVATGRAPRVSMASRGAEG